jgi:hypothetical protein
MKPINAKLVIGTLTDLMVRPGIFYSQSFERISTTQAAGILVLSSLFFAASGTLIDPAGASMRLAMILFVNAVGMVLIGAVIGYLAMAVSGVRRCPFSRMWNIFSLSSGVVLLIAWVPCAFIFTEPWKWCLIGTGLVKGLGMTKARAVIIVLFTFGAMVMVIYSVLPVVNYARALAM